MNKLFILLLLPFLLGAISYETIVPANVQWFNSGIEVYKDDFISISSNGEWQYDPRPNFKTGPDGIIKGNISKGSLLMRCDYDIFLIGSKWEGIIDKNCILEFGMYDDLSYSSNVGKMNLQIKIDRKVIDEVNTDIVNGNGNGNEILSEDNNEDGVGNNEIENQVCGLVAFIVLFLIGVSYVYEKE